jgi:predicted transposase YbfD/YdcC
LGQVATEAKSNEITAIPELLKQIELKDSLITIAPWVVRRRSHATSLMAMAIS